MSEEKTEAPTPRKLREARKRGEVNKSQELTHTAGFTVLLLALLSLGKGLYVDIGQLFSDWPNDFRSLWSRDDVMSDVASRGMRIALQFLFVTEGLVLAGCMLAGFMQVKGVFSFQPMALNAERLLPTSNLKQIFSSNNLLNLVKSLFQVCLILVFLFAVLMIYRHSFVLALQLSPKEILALLIRVLLIFAVCIVGFSWMMAAVDYAHRYYEFMKQHRMTKDEVRREYKDAEGDPMIKSVRRMLHRTYAAVQPIGQSVKRAHVVVTNPTHYAVALYYERGVKGATPLVVDKGVDKRALAIRTAAREFGVPIIEDRPLARKLFHEVEVETAIPKTMFTDVARVLAAAYQVAPIESRRRASNDSLRV